MNIVKRVAIVLAGLCVTAAAMASTTYDLPNSAFNVTPNWSNTTTIVTVGATTFRGPSQFYYVSACAAPNTARYHCSVQREDQVVLTAPDHSTMVVSLTVQFAGVLITSGHNYWRNSQIVVTPSSVTLP